MVHFTKLHIILYFILLLWGINLHSQREKNTPVNFNDKKIDTAKVNMLNRLSAVIYYENIDKSLEYAQKALEAAKKINYIEGIAKSNRYIANCYTVKNNYKEASNYYHESLRINDSLKNIEELVKNWSSLGFLHKSLGNFSTALDYLEKSLAYKDSVKDKRFIAVAFANVGATLYECKKYQESLDFYLQSMDTMRVYCTEGTYASILSNVSSCYITLNQLDSALKYSNMALKIASNLPQKDQPGNIYRQHGFLYETKKDFQQALKYYFKALALDKGVDYDIEVANDLLTIGDLYAKIDMEKALKYYKEGLIYAKRVDAKYILSLLYQNSYNAYLKQQNCNEALKYYMLYTEIDRIIFSDESNKQIAQVSIKYETEKKEQEIIQKNNEIKILQQEKRISNLKKLVIIFCLIILLAGGSIMYLRLRKFYKSQKESHDAEIRFKNADLTNFALNIFNNQKFTENIKENIIALKKNLRDPLMVKQLDHIENQILAKLQLEKDKNELQDKVKGSYQSFYDNLEKSFPDLSKNEKKLAALIRLNLSTKEIATLFDLSVKSVEMGRHRLRKKLNITRDENLPDFLSQF